jgi:hypothetical protein
MCNLYSQTSNAESIGRLFRVSSNRAASFVSERLPPGVKRSSVADEPTDEFDP